MKFILISDAVKLTGLDRQTIRNWVDKGIIPSQKINGTFYVDEDTFVALSEKMRDVSGTEKKLDAYKAKCIAEMDGFRNEFSNARFEHDVNRYKSICVNYGVRTRFFENMVRLMVLNGDLKVKEAEILIDLLNGVTYEELKEKYHTTRERIRKIGEMAIRKSHDLYNIKHKLESVKRLEGEIATLKNDIEVLKKYMGKQTLAEEEVVLSDDEKRLLRMDRLELNAILSQKITNFDLSVRAMNCLYCYKDNKGFHPIKTLGDLCRITRLDYMAQRNAGRKTADEIEAFLKKNNLNWGIDVDKIIKIKL